MRFCGAFLVVSTMLLFGMFFLMVFPALSMQSIPIGAIICGVGLFFFTTGFHEFCHLIALLITHNHRLVIGLRFSYRFFGIRYAGQVPRENASLIYLLSLLTVPATFLALFWAFLMYLPRFLPIKLALPISIVIAVISVPFAFAMSKHDISDWKRSRHGNE